jgi:hypothetical protein
MGLFSPNSILLMTRSYSTLLRSSSSSFTFPFSQKSYFFLCQWCFFSRHCVLNRLMLMINGQRCVGRSGDIDGVHDRSTDCVRRCRTTLHRLEDTQRETHRSNSHQRAHLIETIKISRGLPPSCVCFGSTRDFVFIIS